jgi:hypothetical protein
MQDMEEVAIYSDITQLSYSYTNIQYLVLQFYVSKCSTDLVHALWEALLNYAPPKKLVQ